MRNKQFILWIDDDQRREVDANTLQENLKIPVKFKNVKKKKLISELETIKKGDEPNLAIIDHRLDKTDDSSFVGWGSSVAEILREEWPECPMVSITNMADEIDEHKRSNYEEVIAYDSVSEYFLVLKSMIEGFKIMKRKRPKNISDIIKLLKAPKDDRDQLEVIMPKLIKSNFDDDSLLINIYRWVKHTIIYRPGFLYDKLWASTLLGIKENSFKKVSERFEPAEYKGIFSSVKDERWWQSELKRTLFKALPDEKELLPWKLGTLLPKLSARDKSRCYRADCKDSDPPEVVAYTDESSSKRVQMHRKCTTYHPKYEKSFHFEEILLMDED